MQKNITVNPYEILQLRRKLKNWKKTTPIQCMKILKKVRDMGLNNEILIATEIPRTLVYVANRTRDLTSEDVQKMSKMCRYLAKQWRKQLGVQSTKKEEGEKTEKQQKKQTKQNGSKIQQEKME